MITMPWWGTILVSFGVALVTSIVTFWANERKLKEENKLHNAVEKVLRKLLTSNRWQWRKFNLIKYHIAGFEDDELRKLLVRCGAVRTVSSGDEYWGLIERVQNSDGDGFSSPSKS